MSQPWYKKASVQSALINTVIGTIPAAIIAVASIIIQKNLAEKQLKHQLNIDSIQSIESTKESINNEIRFKSDSILTSKNIRLNQLQLELEYERQRSEVLLAKNMEAVNKQALEVSRKQYDINQNDNKDKRNNNISKLWLALKDIESFDLESEAQYNLSSPDGVVKWMVKASALIEILLQNPLLLENPVLLKGWKDQIESLRSIRWFYVLLNVTLTDSLKNTPGKTDESILINDRKSFRELIIKSQKFYSDLLKDS